MTVKSVFQWRQCDRVKRQIARYLRRPSEHLFANYADWQRYFMQQRLVLGLALGATYFAGRSILIAAQVVSGDGDSTTMYALVYHALPALLMFITLNLIRRRPQPRSLFLGFLLLSWGITILTNLPKGWQDVVEADYKGWTLGFFSIAAIVPFHWPLHLLSHVGAYVYYFGINSVLGQPLFPPQTTPAEFLFDLVWIAAMPNFVVFLYERLSHRQFLAQKALYEAQQRSEQLLFDILPVAIANRLRDERTTIADRFEDVTVLFADIVGFTEFSARLSPDEVVEWLNQIFSEFDRLCHRYGLEKIKTIGDAYMVVGGLPNPTPNHAEQVAQMALAMQQVLARVNQETGQQFEMRIGIHTGPVVAGVIGLHTFAYDLWGDTVNLASRMESHSLPGKIQMSPATRDRLPTHYVCVSRGIVDIKGKGPMSTYWLISDGHRHAVVGQ